MRMGIDKTTGVKTQELKSDNTTGYFARRATGGGVDVKKIRFIVQY